jgi:hypothetical protein
MMRVHLQLEELSLATEEQKSSASGLSDQLLQSFLDHHTTIASDVALNQSKVNDRLSRVEMLLQF